MLPRTLLLCYPNPKTVIRSNKDSAKSSAEQRHSVYGQPQIHRRVIVTEYAYALTVAHAAAMHTLQSGPKAQKWSMQAFGSHLSDDESTELSLLSRECGLSAIECNSKHTLSGPSRLYL